MQKARFVVSRLIVKDRYEFLKGICPNIYYSVKTNPEVAKILEEETDSRFSIHTVNIYDFVKDPARTSFLMESTSREGLERLLDMGITEFIINNKTDLESLLGIAEKKKKRIDLLLRIRFMETTIYKGRFFLYGLTGKEINSFIPALRKNKFIRKLGIHFHRKTQNTGNWNLKYMLEEILTEETIKTIDIVNIGGGFPSDYRNSKATNTDYIVEKIKKLQSWLNSNGIEMQMEPGRPIAAPSVRLETRITMVDSGTVTVNCSVYNSFTDTLTFPLKLLIEGEGKGKPYIVKGCTPDSMDIFRYEAKLTDPKIGDKLTFLNAGAYNFTTDFCNLPKLKTVVQ